MSDRIAVISEGRFVAETTPEEADPETVGLWMGGERTPGDAAADRQGATARPDGGGE